MKSQVLRPLSGIVFCSYYRNVSKELRSAFRRSLRLATPTQQAVADALGRTARLLRMYVAGSRAVTPEVALRFARWLRMRAVELGRAADELERAARKEDDDAT